eukprot:950615-Rhodomonas_salina.3
MCSTASPRPSNLASSPTGASHWRLAHQRRRGREGEGGKRREREKGSRKSVEGWRRQGGREAGRQGSDAT